MSQPSGSAAGMLLVVIGVLALTQVLVGGLVEKILGASQPAPTASKATVGQQAYNALEKSAKAVSKLPAKSGTKP